MKPWPTLMTFHSEQHARKKGKVGSANVRLARVCTNWNPTPMRFSHIDAIPQKRALQLHRCDNDMCAVKSQPLPLRPILMTFLAFSPPAVWPGLDLDTLPHMALHCIGCPISVTFQCGVLLGADGSRIKGSSTMPLFFFDTMSTELLNFSKVTVPC